MGFWGERLNFGIIVTEIQPKVWEEKKKKVERENVEFWQRGYRIFCAQLCCPGVSAWSIRSEKKKKFWQTNCGNAIAEIGKKKNCNNCGNDIAENGESKKKSVTFTIFSQ